MILGALLWALGIALFVLPFLQFKDVSDWRAPDPGRKTEFYSQDEDADEPLDFPFLEDVAYVQEELEFDEDFDAVVSKASLQRYGRDYRGYFAPDHATYETLFVDQAGKPWEGTLNPAPIDLDAAAQSGLFEVDRLMPGQREFLRLCAGCHGPAGDGSGPAARYLDPRPRNFRRGIFKFTSAPWDGRALRSDLFRTITHGLVGSAMPNFRLVPEEKRWDLAEYVRFMAIQGEFEQTMVEWALADEEIPDPEEVWEFVEKKWRESAPVFPAGNEPEADAASIARGKEIFESATTQCSSCHGQSGRGDGPNADAYLDTWGYPIRPRDITTGKLRAGKEGAELYNLIAHGIKGTPMPGQREVLSEEDLWHLVHYIQFLAAGGGSEE